MKDKESQIRKCELKDMENQKMRDMEGENMAGNDGKI